MNKKEANCPFCAPAVLNSCFAECKNFYSVYNVAPILPGHSLIVPKKHVNSIFDLDDIALSEMMIFGKKVISVLSKTFNTISFDWTLQEGIPAGQTIEHLHIHIIPRKEGDLPNPGDWYPRLEQNHDNLIDSFLRPKHTSEELNLIIKKIKANFI